MLESSLLRLTDQWINRNIFCRGWVSHILYLQSTLPAQYLSIIVQLKMNLWCIPYLEIVDDTYLVIDSILQAILINHLYVRFTTLTYAYKLIAWRQAIRRVKTIARTFVGCEVPAFKVLGSISCTITSWTTIKMNRLYADKLLLWRKMLKAIVILLEMNLCVLLLKWYYDQIFTLWCFERVTLSSMKEWKLCLVFANICISSLHI